ncbi:hypothetical protein HMPREF2757_03030 [Brevibacterium sp. HMSC063G07]|nr:hypothetical protein HMPREF2757_03030 [Brevibacterium sp. HMSC063G07]OFS27799.1 hypothetical protein HMPREF3162_00965 [Brevibacterium sp. HMSC07C04]
MVAVLQLLQNSKSTCEKMLSLVGKQEIGPSMLIAECRYAHSFEIIAQSVLFQPDAQALRTSSNAICDRAESDKRMIDGNRDGDRSVNP